MSESVSYEWRRIDDPNRGRTTFRRPLGLTELHFYWDSVFHGTAINSLHAVLEADAESEAYIFAKENIELTWIRLKQRFPLLAASVEELPGSETVEFVLDESSLFSIRPGEVVVNDDLTSMGDVAQLVEELRNGQPVLNNEIIAKLIAARQNDTPHRYHVFVVITHYVYDGTGGSVLMRELCQELASLSNESRVLNVPLAERLARLLPQDVLGRDYALSRPRRRWRLAAAKIIRNLRRTRLTGGHTLPTLRPVSFCMPAYSCTIVSRLSASVLQRVVRTSRALGITLGSALPVLSQLALTRVLHRRRRREAISKQPEISDEDWEYRRIQPMHFTCPHNVRPYLDRSWYESGGAEEVCVAVGFHELVLPPMPTPKPLRQTPSKAALTGCSSTPPECWTTRSQNTSSVFSSGSLAGTGDPYESCVVRSGVVRPSISTPLADGGAPSFSSLLSRNRFLARARMIRAQTTALFRHPLFSELHAARIPEAVRLSRASALAWRAKQNGQSEIESGGGGGSGAVTFREAGNCVFSNCGANFGDRDKFFPLEYPLRSSSSATQSSSVRLQVCDTDIYLRCRPGDLYLGAFTSCGDLKFITFVDANVYDPDVVREWMEDVKAATVHYLGGGGGDEVVSVISARL